MVRASLAAAAATRRQLRVYAVEKNPSAVVHIQAMVVAQGWEEVVTIVGQDMRLWEPPEKVRRALSPRTRAGRGWGRREKV